MHGMTTQALEGGWGAFHIWQAVPIFIVLLGLNAAHSAQRTESSSGATTAVRARRLLPIWIIIVVSIVGGMITGRGELGRINFAGWLPLRGPGNYFIVIVVEFVVLFPLLWWRTSAGRCATVVGMMAIEARLQPRSSRRATCSRWRAPGMPGSSTRATIPHWLGGIALGIWLAANPDLFARRNRWIVGSRRGQHRLPRRLLGNLERLHDPPGPAEPHLVPLRSAADHGRDQVAPRTGGFCSEGLGVIGQASLHIFLVQMLWFGQTFYYVADCPSRGRSQSIPNLIICITGGHAVVVGRHDTRRVRRLMARSGRGRIAPRLRPTLGFSKTQ